MTDLKLTSFLALMGLVSALHAVEAPARALVTSTQPAGTLDVSLRHEVDAAIDRATQWLASQQKPNGAWSNESYPALTGLAVSALHPARTPAERNVIGKAVTFMTSCVQPDGGIYQTIPGRKGGGLSNYNTAICMTALHQADATGHLKTVQNARTFIAGAQHFGDDAYTGGFGYDKATDRAYADLLNTFYSVEAMRVTQSVEDLRPAGEKKVDIDWTETVKFVEGMQNKAAAGTDQEGGFFYKPGESKAGTLTNKEGVVYFRSYGSMTYAGVLAMVYAQVERDDIRVRSALDWAGAHWSLEENPGMGSEGLFFFYNVLAKSLDVAGTDLLPAPDNKFIDWRQALAKKLVRLQTIDPKTGHGYWTNEDGRFWERDPVLVTAYVLSALRRL